ncbi:unnamed protein product [Peronospora effusa]|uniref:Uncharacterized protein n=1 Tax=Peronospora effusa TaxID=542832 RepID=A0A3M6VBA5_9STRA|nr:hypothetical protein DD238_005866 [Peronospora effusa]RQM13389.1 hypothetical protein DD237_006034 [Peronospora effusa]CAI5702191.1 unnamed protein product [Peronospora effusa]
MAPSRRRVGRTLRRSRRRTATYSSTSTRSTSGLGPLQVIGENTIVELTGDDDALDSDTRFGLPSMTLGISSPKKQKNLRKKNKKTKKRPRESTLFRREEDRLQQLETLLDELETQGLDKMQEQCDEIMADAERRAQELEVELKMQLLIMPAAVRQMPWKTFVEDFGGDLNNAVYSLSQLQTSPSSFRSSIARHDIVAATPCVVADHEKSDEDENDDTDHTSRDHRLSVFMTPLNGHRTETVPRTVLRTAHKGETTYSIRGSPIIPDTVAKAPAGSLVATFEKGLEPTTCLRLDSERVLNLARPEELSAQSRGEATSKLKALQAKIAQLLQQINPCVH